MTKEDDRTRAFLRPLEEDVGGERTTSRRVLERISGRTPQQLAQSRALQQASMALFVLLVSFLLLNASLTSQSSQSPTLTLSQNVSELEFELPYSEKDVVLTALLMDGPHP